MEYASETNDMEIAIIGVAVCSPQSRTLHEFWYNIVQGKECVTFLSKEELPVEGAEQSTLDNPAYVWAKPYIGGMCDFGAALFSYSYKEAQALDPKPRVLYKVAYHALEDTGYAQHTSDLTTGVFAGASEDVD